MTQTIEKTPAAELLYGRGWGDWLGPGEVITESTWTITPASAGDDDTPLIQAPDTPSGWEGPETFVRLTGGTLGRFYRVVNRITTSLGQTDERTFSIKVVDR